MNDFEQDKISSWSGYFDGRLVAALVFASLLPMIAACTLIHHGSYRSGSALMLAWLIGDAMLLRKLNSHGVLRLVISVPSTVVLTLAFAAAIFTGQMKCC